VLAISSGELEGSHGFSQSRGDHLPPPASQGDGLLRSCVGKQQARSGESLAAGEGWPASSHHHVVVDRTEVFECPAAERAGRRRLFK